jgi:hypothetical protein
MNLSAVALSLKISKEIVVALFISFLRLWKFQSNLTQLQLLEELSYQIVFDTFYLTVNNLSSAVTTYFTISFLALSSETGTKPISYSKPILQHPKKIFVHFRRSSRRFNLSDCTKRSKAKSTFELVLLFCIVFQQDL